MNSSNRGIVRREDDHSIFMKENATAQEPHYNEPVGLKDLPVTIVYQTTSTTFPGTNKSKIEEALKKHVYHPGAFVPSWKYFKLDKITVT